MKGTPAAKLHAALTAILTRAITLSSRLRGVVCGRATCGRWHHDADIAQDEGWAVTDDLPRALAVCPPCLHGLRDGGAEHTERHEAP